MSTSTLTLLLQIAGFLHLGLVWAGATMPRAVNLREHLQSLPPFIRRLFLVYFAFIGLVLVGFGALTFFFANEMAACEPVARGLCSLMLMFWIVRLCVALFVFDVRPYLRTSLYRAGYYATNFVFLYLVVVYALAVIRGGME